jgi:uncharacterized protein
MQDLSRAQKQLAIALLDLHDDAMLLEELDGFVAGLLVCPEMIPPSDWLPVIWHSEGGDGAVFEDLAHANKVMGLVKEHYNDVAGALFERPGDYAPLFAIDRRNSDVLWEIWIAGFEKAVKLRPAAWLPLVSADSRTAQAWRGLKNLAELASSPMRRSEEEYNALTEGVPDKIAGWVLDLNEWRLAHYQPPAVLRTETNPFAARSGKVGRNDPCPCGSGKKYKKCCGLN